MRARIGRMPGLLQPEDGLQVLLDRRVVSASHAPDATVPRSPVVGVHSHGVRRRPPRRSRRAGIATRRGGRCRPIVTPNPARHRARPRVSAQAGPGPGPVPLPPVSAGPGRAVPQRRRLRRSARDDLVVAGAVGSAPQ